MRIGYVGRGNAPRAASLESGRCDSVQATSLSALMAMVGPGDVVVVRNLAVLGSTAASSAKAVVQIGNAGAELVALDEGIDTELDGVSLFAHAAAFAAVNPAKGRKAQGPKDKGGRPKADTTALERAAQMRAQGSTVEEACGVCGVKRSTLYRFMKEAAADT
ncbi:MAG: hypothetical protein RR842_08775 [Gordonibacter sp.]|uniref:hypothetical protein n=1 Tax=Gordonibacter sp. TaxID=1968902 RepID=UPI002B383659|nr:hypothetical protein [Gordonibacter sp.]